MACFAGQHFIFWWVLWPPANAVFGPWAKNKEVEYDCTFYHWIGISATVDWMCINAVVAWMLINATVSWMSINATVALIDINANSVYLSVNAIVALYTDSIHCTLYTVHCTLYNGYTQRTVQSVHCLVYSVQCKVYSCNWEEKVFFSSLSAHVFHIIRDRREREY